LLKKRGFGGKDVARERLCTILLWRKESGMTTQDTSKTQTLAPFYKGWDAYQDRLVQAVAPLNDEQLGLKMAPHLRSIGRLAGRIIGTRVWWLQEILIEGGPELETFYDWGDDDGPEVNASDLVNGLQVTWHVIQNALARWTPESLDERFFVHYRHEYVSRQWIIWHLIEHDLHYGCELSLALMTHGLDSTDI